MSNHDPQSRASRNLIVRLGQTLQGNTALFDDVFVDPLHPQLLNRKAFDRVFDDADLRGLVWSVTYADADGLKRLNDSAGHDAGDDFLRVIVDTWALATRSWDRADSLIFRLGGDEFAVLWFQDGGAGPKRLQDAWDIRLACYADQGVTQAWTQVDAAYPLADALEEAEATVRAVKADRSRTEVEELRARVAELEAERDRYRDRAQAEQEVRHEAREEDARRIADLQTQIEGEQREQDRLRLEVERRTDQRDIERSLRRDAELSLKEAEEGRERLRARLSKALTDVEAVKSELADSEAARDRLRARFFEAERIVAEQAEKLSK